MLRLQANILKCGHMLCSVCIKKLRYLAQIRADPKAQSGMRLSPSAGLAVGGGTRHRPQQLGAKNSSPQSQSQSQSQSQTPARVHCVKCPWCREIYAEKDIQEAVPDSELELELELKGKAANNNRGAGTTAAAAAAAANRSQSQSQSQPQAQSTSTSNLNLNSKMGNDKLSIEHGTAQDALLGRYGTKISSLVKEIKRVCTGSGSGSGSSGSSDSGRGLLEAAMASEQPSKCLVFSTWEEVLSLAEMALKDSGIRVARMSSNKVGRCDAKRCNAVDVTICSALFLLVAFVSCQYWIGSSVLRLRCQSRMRSAKCVCCLLYNIGNGLFCLFVCLFVRSFLCLFVSFFVCILCLRHSSLEL